MTTAVSREKVESEHVDPESQTSKDAAAAREHESALLGHLDQAMSLLRAGNLEGARGEIDAALRLAPEDVRAVNLRGLWLYRSGRYDEALPLYTQLSQRHGGDAALWLNLGLVKLRLGMATEAADDLMRVVGAEPDNTRARAYLGLALLRAGELEAARNAFLQAGQDDLARQVDERLNRGREGALLRSELRRVASDGFRALERDNPFSSVDVEAISPPSPAGTWQLLAGGKPAPAPAAPVSTMRAEPSGLKLDAPLPVAAFASACLVR